MHAFLRYKPNILIVYGFLPNSNRDRLHIPIVRVYIKIEEEMAKQM